MANYLIGVDVGTGSARAGLFTPDGTLVAMAVEPIEMWRPRPDFAEQSSTDIWNAVRKVTRQIVRDASISPEEVVGISYDATCSLVVLDKAGNSLAVNDEGVNERNIIVWMDHRAIEETEFINEGKHEVLKFVGGRISPEMETPKLKWLKKNLPNTWQNAGKFLDLADFLTYKSTGVDARSLCTVVCKWTYLGHEQPDKGWDREYLSSIGIDDAFDGEKISNDVRPMGTYIGNLTHEAASELGLTTNCAVGIGIIDAHAGGLGLLGAVWDGSDTQDLSLLETALALIGGTSNCHMAVSREAKYIPGIWGPYYGAMVPGMWLTEGGQSTAGSAIDFAITNHANAPNLHIEAAETGKTVYELLNAEIERLRHTANLDHAGYLTLHQYVLPYLLGNRSPNADPHVRAIFTGISLDQSKISHALAYYSAIQGVAYGTRDIAEAMNASGYNISRLFVTGGGTKNPLWLQEHADATGMTLILPQEKEAVLLGSAILAASAAGIYPSVTAAMQKMSKAGSVVKPTEDKRLRDYHTAKFQNFRQIYRDSCKWRENLKAWSDMERHLG